jgi:hypothetical protein
MAVVIDDDSAEESPSFPVSEGNASDFAKEISGGEEAAES